ncbi:MAG: ClpXP protease specificity-enhancing factor SspB [Deltaproteobacteria bacterium]|nr:ClpXP protease specificity-enhancing factor SspB [Deltaproteobacteria bacterium]
MTPTDRPSKQEAFTAFLQDGWVTVYIDARRAGVSVPDHLRNEARLVLQYGLNMPVPVEDLEVTEGGVKATLSFARQPHKTLIPWTAIYVIACTDGRGVLYQEDVPPELLVAAHGIDDPDDAGKEGESDIEGAARKSAALPLMALKPQPDDAEDPPAPAPRARLKSVPLDEPPQAEDDNGRAPEPSKPDDGGDGGPKGRPTLRLVK